MKRLKRFKLFEATEELIQDIYLDFKDKVLYLQDLYCLGLNINIYKK